MDEREAVPEVAPIPEAAVPEVDMRQTEKHNCSHDEILHKEDVDSADDLRAIIAGAG